MKAERLDLCTTKGLSERLSSSYVLYSVGPNWLLLSPAPQHHQYDHSRLLVLQQSFHSVERMRMKAEGLDLCTTKGLSERLSSSYVLHSVGPNWLLLSPAPQLC